MHTEKYIGPPAGSGGGRTVRAGFLEKVMPELGLKGRGGETRQSGQGQGKRKKEQSGQRKQQRSKPPEM